MDSSTNVASIAVTVPATTANLGPGFDCLGAALTLYNQVQFSRLPTDSKNTLAISVTGAEADRVTLTADNLLYQAFAKLYHHLGQTPPAVKIDIHLEVPLARGLGSSATAIVAGLVGANALAGSPLSSTEVMQLAIAMEGHPDNVVPALLGGCCLSATDVDVEPSWQVCTVPWHDSIVPIVAIPNFELSTQAARQVLPSSYSRADAIFNMAHLGLLLRGLETGHADWLRAALQDRIHQPYRQTLIPGYQTVYDAAIAAGAYGLVISGAGPTLLALTERGTANQVQEAIAIAWAMAGTLAQVKILAIDNQGAQWLPLTS